VTCAILVIAVFLGRAVGEVTGSEAKGVIAATLLLAAAELLSVWRSKAEKGLTSGDHHHEGR